MTERQIENRIKKLQAIEAQQKALEKEAEALKQRLKQTWKQRELMKLRQQVLL